MRSLVIVAALASASVARAAEPILVPEFTPGTQAEFTATVMIQGMVVDRLTSDGYIVLGNDVVGPVVGDQAVANCASQPSCPKEILPRLPTRIAVVSRISRSPNGLIAHLEVYEQSRNTPVVSDDMELPPGGEGLLAEEVSKAVGWLVGQIGPSPEPVVAAAARLLAGQSPKAVAPSSAVPVPAPQPVPAPAPRPVPQPVAQPVPQPVAPQPVTQPSRPTAIIDLDGPDPKKGGRSAAAGDVPGLGSETGVYPRHVMGSEENWRSSGMDPRDWVYKQMPHAGRFAFEVRAGLGMGDVDRMADLRVEVLNTQNEIGQSMYAEAPQTARRPRGGVFVGYAPTTFFDFGMLLGLQYGQRFVSTGYARVPADASAQATVNSAVHEPVDAVQLYVQPRIRGYIVPVGPAKPFVFTGAQLRVFNVYETQQPAEWSYPLPPGGVVPGWVGGGGLMLDPSPIVGFFFEGSFTQHFGSRAKAVSTSAWTYETLRTPYFVGYTVGVVGGVQFRI